jgi:hypothetical protein
MAGAAKFAQIAQIVSRHYADRAPVDSIVVTLDALKGSEPHLAESVLDGLVAGWPDRADAAPALTTPTSLASPPLANRSRPSSATGYWCLPIAGASRRSSRARWKRYSRPFRRRWCPRTLHPPIAPTPLGA